MTERICLINNSSHSFTVHRYRLYKYLVQKGYDVSVILPEIEHLPQDPELKKKVHLVSFSRKSINPFSELTALLDLHSKIKELKPDLIHNFTIKPVLYGTIAGRCLGLPKIINTMTGLGYIFTTHNFLTLILRTLILFIYKLFFNSQSVHIIFQNEDDMKLLMSYDVLPQQNCSLIYGSGVDTDFFSAAFEKSQNSKPVIICVTRLLREKGVAEFVQAIKLLNLQNQSFEAWLVGATDPENFGSFTQADIATWTQIPQLKVLGYQKDVRTLLDRADIFCLPSYREGLPMANLEAASMSLPIVTTDAPGCNKTVIDGKNGFLVPVLDANKLAEKLKILIDSADLRRQMGLESRALALQTFSSTVISQKISALYNSENKV